MGKVEIGTNWGQGSAPLPTSVPLGNDRFYARIEAMTGQRRDPKPRCRPKKPPDEGAARDADQRELPL